MQIEIRNMTPHDISIMVLGGTRVIPPSGTVARVRTRRMIRDAIAFGSLKISCSEIESIAVDGVPEPQPGVVYLVSTFVAQHPSVRGRPDVMAPDLHSATRDGNGNVVAISNFVRYS